MEISDISQRLSTEPSSPDLGLPPTVLIGDAEQVDVASSCMLELFATSDVQELRVRLPEGKAGYLSRDAFLDLQTPRSKGAEDGVAADFFGLPGLPQLAALSFRCPVDGEQFSYFLVDSDRPPECERHRGVHLRWEA